MSKSGSNSPFLSLGSHLKALREKMKESLAEVSGAVEIDEDLLSKYEHGDDRPSEDVLMLLISHFGMQDDEAATLWELAGYDNPPRKNETNSGQNDDQTRSVMVMMTLDSRILYTDGAQISADKNGVVFSFSQNSGELGGNQRVPVARIGMSYDQARNFMNVLTETFNKANSMKQPKGLPWPKKSPEDKKSDNN